LNVIGPVQVSYRWKLRNMMRFSFLRGLVGVSMAKALSEMTGVLTVHGELAAKALVVRDEDRPYLERLRELARHDPDRRLAEEIGKILGRRTQLAYGLLSYRVITDAGVAYLVDDWDSGANVIDNFNYHGCGTGATAEAAGDTALVTESTTALNPDSTRATGTKSQPAANQARSVGTLTFDASAAITEHGLFTQAATGGGTLWDRSVFAAINVASADSIQFTYTATFTSGS
jgi:hypothetical protein